MHQHQQMILYCIQWYIIEEAFSSAKQVLLLFILWVYFAESASVLLLSYDYYCGTKWTEWDVFCQSRNFTSYSLTQESFGLWSSVDSESVFPNKKALTDNNHSTCSLTYNNFVNLITSGSLFVGVLRACMWMCAEHFRRHCANSPGVVRKACFLNLIANYISALALLSTTQLPSQK